MQVSITNVHLDLGAGRRGTDMGPSAIHVAGLVPQLTGLGHEVVGVSSIASEEYESVPDVGDPNARFLEPIRRTCAELADRVEAQAIQGVVPLVLGGDHAQAIGTIAGLARARRPRRERVGVLWIDAHTDMNTPETTESGNI
ncbi:MAG: arginase family protein, partial [Myxococcota bacterium]